MNDFLKFSEFQSPTPNFALCSHDCISPWCSSPCGDGNKQKNLDQSMRCVKKQLRIWNDERMNVLFSKDML